MSSFQTLGLSERVPLKLGHDGDAPFKDGQPALGWVKHLYREGKKLVADLTGIPESLYSFIKEGLYKFVSVELLADVKAGTREIPWVLDAVALLGADPPAVGILKDLQALTMARSTEFQCRERVAFTRESSTTGVKPTMADEIKNEEVAKLLERLNKAEDEAKTLRIQAARTTEAETKLSEFQTQVRNEKIVAHRAKLMDMFEAPIKEKKILPSVREQFKRVYKTESDAVLDVTAADAEVFIRANPNPDAPKAPTTLNTSDPNDPAEKALTFARARMREERDTGKTPDQIVLEAIQAQMRANPELAQAWKVAPGGAV